MTRLTSVIGRETCISAETSFSRSYSTLGTPGQFRVFGLAVLVVFLCYGLNQAQSIQYTQNKPDHALRSAMRVDPSTLGLSIEVPIAGYPGRGGASLPINLSYSSKQWRIDFTSSYLTVLELPRTVSHPKFSEWAKTSWTSSADVPRVDWNVGIGPYNDDGTPWSGSGSQLYINRMRIHMPGGVSHEMRLSDTPASAQTVVGTFYSVDSSNLRYESTSFYDGILYVPDGSRYVLTSTDCQFIDRHGNTLNYNAANRQWTDTQNRVLDVPLHTSPTATTYTYNLPSTTSTPVSYGVRWSTLQNALTNSLDDLCYVSNMTPDNSQPGDLTIPREPALFFGDQADRVYGEAEKFNPMVLAEIILPNGQHYLFTYNVWGEITKVIYPTGAYEKFDHEAVASVGFLQSPYAQANRGVVHRALSPSGNGGDELHWSYTAVASSNVLTIGTTAPDLSVSEHLLNAETSQQSNYFGFSNAALGTSFEDRLKAPGQGGAILRRTLTDWTTVMGPTGIPRDPRVTKQVEMVLDNPTGNALTATTKMFYDDDLNVIATKHYDFTSISRSSAETSAIGSITAGSLLRTEEATFLVNDTAINSTVRAAYRTRNLLNLPTSTRVKNGSETMVAQSLARYDNYDENGQPGSYPLLYDAGATNNWSDPGNIRGLPTTNGVWLNTTNGYLQSHTQYDQFGNVRNSWDAKGNQSQMTYSSAYAYAYPTTLTTAVPDPTGVYGLATGLTSTAEYHALTGLMTTLVDANGQTTSYTYDGINRPATIVRPSGGGSTSFNYGDSPGDLYVRTQTSLDSTRVVEAHQYYDKLGRPNRSFQKEGDTYSTTDVKYDSMGRSWRSSNPYRTTSLSAAVNPSDLWTTTGYDYLGRVTSIATSDGAAIGSAYACSISTPLGPVVTVTDQAGKLHRSLMDALGRLIRSDEPDNSSANGSLGAVDSPQQTTSYSYDTLGNLLEVNQGTQVRTFVYDSLSRLLSATNPESGRICYGTLSGVQCQTDGYDANGNLIYKTDARDVRSSYTYDALNRNTTIDYSNTTIGSPNVADITRAYDGATIGKGRLWKSYAGGNATAGSNVEHTRVSIYDALGQPLTQVQEFKTNGVWSSSFTTHRTYNLSGDVTSLTYPSGHIVNYTSDAGGQTESFTGNLGDGTPRSYSSEITYSPVGGIVKEKFGTDIPIYNKFLYNSRWQLAEIRESTTSATDTSWNLGAVINHYGNQGGCWGASCDATDNNGNLWRQEVYIRRPNSENYDNFAQFYDYDSLNRLQAVRETLNTEGVQWQQTFVYDRYGNRTIDQNVANTYGSGINKKDFTVNLDGKNRLGVPGGQSGTMTYDSAGNLTTDTYSADAALRAYDGENRMTSQTNPNQYTVAAYNYNADGQRVRRNVGDIVTWQIYGFEGELLSEYELKAGTPALQKEYGYRNGELLVAAGTEGENPAGWTNAVGVSISGNSLTKNGAGKSAWNGGAVSLKPINAGDGYMEFTAAETNKARRAGLSNGDVNQSWDDIDYCIFLDADGTVAINEGTALRGSFGTYASGDRFHIGVEGGVVKYRKNGTLIYTSTVAPTYPLSVDTSFFTLGATINNVVSHETGLRWLVSDQLGTPRMIFDQTGTLAGVSHHDYLPFGEDIFAGTGGRTTTMGYSAADGVRQKFTQKERDDLTGLDYSDARYYSPIQGRFTSPDPMLSSGRPSLPQSWNRYTYVINQPLSLVDPHGLDWGVAQFDDNGVWTTEYRWFWGGMEVVNNHQYFPVHFGPDGFKTINTSDGRTVIITNDPAKRMKDITIHAKTTTLPVLEPSWMDHVPILNTSRQFLFHFGTHNFEGALLDFGKLSLELGTLNVGAAAGTTASFATRSGEAIFYSGARQLATQAAKTEGGKLISQTLGGRALTLITKPLPERLAAPFWNWGSKKFAQGAHGEIRVFLANTLRNKATWELVEYPILRVNPFVRVITR